MSVSVIVTTISLGGLDMLFNSMQAQRTGIAFEVIVVDEWHEQRAPLLSSRSGKFKFHVKHLPPRKHHDYIDHCCGWNTGLAAAEGELVCFLNDFIWAYPTYIEDHWTLYKEIPGYSGVGYLDRYPWPRVKESKVVEDIWWNCFDREWFADEQSAMDFFTITEPVYRERKGWRAGAQVYESRYKKIPGELFYASLNESIPRQVLKEINGWDERFDHSYGKNDIDLGMRAECIGWHFALLPTVNQKIGMDGMARPVHSITKQRLPKERNEQMLELKWNAIKAGLEPIRTPHGFGAFE